MKKLFTLLMMPLISLAQSDSLNVSDLLGEWYGVTTNGSSCNNLPTCGPVKSLDNKTYIAYKYRISQNNDKLVINNISNEDSALFHGNVSKSIYISFASNNTLPITNGKVKSTNSAIQLINNNTLYFGFLDMPGLTLKRSKGDYDKLLLSQNALIENGCAFLEQGIICNTATNDIETLNVFSIKNDTLIYHRFTNKEKYLYNELKKEFYNCKTPQLTFKLNTKTANVLFKNATDSLEHSLANNISNAQLIEWFKGEWISTSRQGKFISFNTITNIYNSNSLITNSIDALHEVKITSPNGYMVPNEQLVDTLTTIKTFLYGVNLGISASTKGFLYVEALDTRGYSKITTTLKPQWFSIGTNDVIQNLLTGEEFSKVTSVIDNSIESQISINPNPATSDYVKVSGIDNFNYEIFNSTGILLKQGQSNSGTIAVDDLPQGLMTVKINNSKNQYITKLVK